MDFWSNLVLFNQTMTTLLLVVVAMAMMVTSSLGGNKFPALRDNKIQEHLKRLNKPAVKSINSPDGDIIDCVFITNQPAFDHPMLKNHTIQMNPSVYPKGVYAASKVSSRVAGEPKAITQLWNRNGKCPKNTVPIVRTKKEDLLRAISIEKYARRSSGSIHKPQANDPTKDHEYAVARDTSGNLYGTKATISLWKPKVQLATEFSLAQLWLTSGSYEKSDHNSIEAGWQIYPNLYGDYNTRFFIYWTRNAYNGTGCYNLKCSGFVQTGNDYVIGGSFPDISTYNGSQYFVTLLVWKDTQTGNWWLQINNKMVGYWPRSIFTRLARAAEKVEWGGEIINLKTNGKHTTTEMGSGRFASEGYSKAGYFKNIQVIDGSNNLKDPNPKGFQIITTNNNCYDLKIGSGDVSSGTYFYFGGPGRNPKCP